MRGRCVEHGETIAGFVIDRLQVAASIDASLYIESGEDFVREAGSIGSALNRRVRRNPPMR